MNVTEFFLKYNNKLLDYDGVNGGQCVDVIKAYFVEVLNLPVFKGNAIDYWTDINGLTRIKRGFFNQPLPGDIIIFDKSFGQYGHIGIANWTRSFDFNCFEQNNPLGSPCHYQDHASYRGVIGWLRPNNLPPPSPAQPTLPKTPLKIAWIGSNLPQVSDFQSQIWNYSSQKISCVVNDYAASFTGKITQDQAYGIVDQWKPKEKFVFIFYTPTDPGDNYYTSYYYPKADCCITTCPGTDPRDLAFEFGHQLGYMFNEHRGSLAPVVVQDVASNNSQPTDDLIKSKYDLVSQHYL